MRTFVACVETLALCLLSRAASAESETAAGPTYVLDLSRDIPALLLGSAAAVTPLFQREAPPAWCAPVCDPDRVNALDRPAAGFYRPAWAIVSDVTLGALMATPVFVLIADEGAANALNDFVVVAETLVISSGFASLTSAAVRRPRPFMYSDAAPLSKREEGNGALSFFSEHTTNAFAASLALYSTLKRRYPDSAGPLVVLGSTLAAASLVGTSRVLAGNHFPTDVAAGALVGSSMGILVPALHGSGLAVSPAPAGSAVGLALSGFW